MTIITFVPSTWLISDDEGSAKDKTALSQLMKRRKTFHFQRVIIC